MQKTISSWNPTTSVSFLVMAILLSLLLTANFGPIQAAEYERNVVSVMAEYSDVFLPSDISKVYFDTSMPLNAITTSELSGLGVDSIVQRGEVMKITDERELEGIRIGLDSLASTIRRHRVTSISRMVPSAIPYDTVGWNWKRERSFTKADLSKFFILCFDSTVIVDSIIGDLRCIVELEDVSKIPAIEALDGMCEVGAPGDPNDGWDLTLRLADQSGGVNSQLAWALLDNLGTYGLANIAFIEDGVDWRHEDLASKYSGCGDTTLALVGASGHGTMSVGIAAAVSCNLKGRKGQAPDAGIYAYNYLEGESDPNVPGSAVIDDLNRAVNEDIADLVDFSFPFPDSNHALYLAVQNTKSMDIPMIATAGNLSSSTAPAKIQFPAQWTELTIAVGAQGITGNVYSRSNFGDPTATPPVRDFVDVIAPGYYVNTTAMGGGYDLFTGTSAAAPVVAGIVALALDYSPDLKFDEIQSWLRESANHDGNYDPLKYGAGRVDAYKFMHRVVFGSSPESPYLNPGPRTPKEAKEFVFTNPEVEKRKSAVQSIKNQSAMPRQSKEYERLLAETKYPHLYPGGGRLSNTLQHRRAQTVDSIPYIIVTSASLAAYWEQFAQQLTIEGTRTLIVTPTEYQSYDGVDDQEKIRNCLIDYATNNHLQYVLLGGDYADVPYRIVRNDLRGTGQEFVSDYYYACLDGNWDADADQIYGEPEDNVDLLPELAVGRLPVSNGTQVATYFSKWSNYLRDVSQNPWQLKAFAMGSQMYAMEDGPTRCEQVLSNFPQEFTITEMYDLVEGSASVSNYQDAMNAGQGLVLCHGLAQHEANYFLDRQNNMDVLSNSDVDALASTSKPAIVYASTCWNNMLELDCMSKHYINHPYGGAVSYVGSSYNDYPYATERVTDHFFQSLFSSESPNIGPLLNEAKQVLVDESNTENGARHTMMAFTLLGDPSLRMWTGTPQTFSISAPAAIFFGVGVQRFEVTVTDGSNPVSDATVCLEIPSFGPQGQLILSVYHVVKTDANGRAFFSDIEMPPYLSQVATINVSKTNFVTRQVQMQVIPTGEAGDVDDNDMFTISDEVFLINYIFASGPAPAVMNRGDVDTSCTITISDAVYMVNAIFAGGPAPMYGCVTLPVGGKQTVASDDPSDAESPLVGTSPSTEIKVTADVSDGNSRLIWLQSSRTIYGLSITLNANGDSKIGVESLLESDEAVQIFWSQQGKLVKIGLIDPYGQRYLRPGIKPILRVTGDFSISYSLAADRGLDNSTISLQPSVENSDTSSEGLTLEPNYPNPFNPTTMISFNLPKGMRVSLDVYNVLGQKVRTLIDDFLPAGRQNIEWNGTDDAGQSVSSGIYFARLTAGEFHAGRKMLMVK